jgi:polyisoprenyl-phosphate glycosyltransferase
MLDLAVDTSSTIIITPVFNDWESFSHLVHEIDKALAPMGERVEILAVDDSSTEPAQPFAFGALACIKTIRILELARNMGHQRAIAVGLAYAQEHLLVRRVLVLDSDGEDRPQDLPQLITESQNSNMIVFAQRGSRTENWVFRLFYRFYCIIFRIFTGKQISFGNFSIIPANLLVKVVHLPEIWNHFAAGIMRSGLPRTAILLPRGQRYTGKSKMNFVSLVLHGLSAISVYIDTISVRIILFTLGVIAAVFMGLLGVVFIRFFTTLAIPGWTTNVGIGLVVILSQAILLLVSLAILTLGARSTSQFIPIKQYKDYLLDSKIIYD